MLRAASVTFFTFALSSGYSHAADPIDLLQQLRATEAEAAERAAEAAERAADPARQQHLNRYGEFHLHNDGSVTIHGLQWMRCSLGQQWEPDPASPSDGTCSGDAMRISWDDASQLVVMFNDAGGFAGHTDWRLPSITELDALRLCRTGRTRGEARLPGGESTFSGCDDSYRPTIDIQVFPNTPSTSAWFWSNSPTSAGRMLAVDFSNAIIFDRPVSSRDRVRLVRGGH